MAEKLVYSTPQISKVKKDTTTTVLSHQESLNLEPTSSYNNESSGVREKSKKQCLDLDRISQNISSQGVEMTSNLASQEP